MEIKHLFSGLVKRTDYNTKITDIEKKLTDHNHDNSITNPEFNKFTADILDARLAWSYLVTKVDFDTKQKTLNQKLNSNETKYLLVENELKKLQIFDSIYFRGKYHFGEGGTQNYLVFKPMYIHFKRFSGFGSGKLKDCLIKILQLLLQLIIASIHN